MLQNFKQYEKKYLDAFALLRSQTFIYDTLFGIDNLKFATTLIPQTVENFSSASMNLCKWITRD